MAQKIKDVANSVKEKITGHGKEVSNSHRLSHHLGCIFSDGPEFLLAFIINAVFLARPIHTCREAKTLLRALSSGRRKHNTITLLRKSTSRMPHSTKTAQVLTRIRTHWVTSWKFGAYDSRRLPCPALLAIEGGLFWAPCCGNRGFCTLHSIDVVPSLV